MPIVEQYGIRITDRVKITRVGSYNYQAFFDSEYIGGFESGPLAAAGANKWLEQRSKEQSERDKAKHAQEVRDQERRDTVFLYRVFPHLDGADLDTLIEVLKRRLVND